MWQKKAIRSIMPLVSDLSNDHTASMHNLLSRMLLPEEEWRYYANSRDTAKDRNGDFIIKTELMNFLLPYKDIINVPITPTHFRMLLSFLIKISHENSREINELHLSKVIVLLELFADVNLPPSDRISYINPLETIFLDNDMGRDVLNLLFSYGLTYETFSLHLNCFLTRVKGKESIDSKILDLTDNNDYITVYRTLRDAYIAYQNKNYKTAKELYQTAHDLLNILKDQSGLSLIISKNYAERAFSAEEYRNICAQIEREQKIPQKDMPVASLLCRSYTAKLTTDEDIAASNHPLLDNSESYKNK